MPQAVRTRRWEVGGIDGRDGQGGAGALGLETP
jgi:hypothetical protein